MYERAILHFDYFCSLIDIQFRLKFCVNSLLIYDIRARHLKTNVKKCFKDSLNCSLKEKYKKVKEHVY